MKILVAEDNAVSGTLITGALTRHGYTIVLARNGSEALGFLNSDPDIQGVITDIMMPESSGLDLLRPLRAHETWRSLPAIVITVRDDHETVAEAFALGCKDYLLKPIRPDLLLERVANVFRPKKVILMNPFHVMSQYSLSSEAYRRIAMSFACQVERAISEVKNWSPKSRSVYRLDFAPIVEGATVLGAERLLRAVEGVATVAGSPILTLHQRADILEELQIVQGRLHDQIGAAID
jgi:CheY-like chemotaxis protein